MTVTTSQASIPRGCPFTVADLELPVAPLLVVETPSPSTADPTEPGTLTVYAAREPFPVTVVPARLPDLTRP